MVFERVSIFERPLPMSDTQKLEFKPKYKIVAEDLRSQIASGRHKEGEQLPSIQQLVRTYGVSLSTVRQSLQELSNEGLIRAEHGRGVFVNDRISSGEFAIVVQAKRLSESASPYHRLGCTALAAVLHEEFPGCQTRLHVGKRPRWGDAFADTLDLLERHVSSRLRGVFSLEDISSIEESLLEKGIPLVAVGTPSARYCVYFDSRQLVTLGLKQLRKVGCRSVGIIRFSGPDAVGVEIRREKTKWQQHDSEFHSYTVQPESANSVERRGYECFMDLWQRPGRPEGVLVGDDILGRGVLRAILQLGISVPQELRLVSHSNRGVELPYHLPVTRLEFDHGRLVREAVAMMSKLLGGEKPQRRHVVLSPELIVGAT